MKIIQSLWTKPVIQCFTSDKVTSTGGWPTQKHFLMSWALSFNTIASKYSEINLFTDEFGRYLLCDILDLPYSKVYQNLECLDNADIGLWALSKFEAYKAQNEPFIHVDGDIFLFDRINLNFDSIITQNEECNFEDYNHIWEDVTKYYDIPKFLIDDYKNFNDVHACNTGIFGGYDLDFINMYIKEVASFLNVNRKNFHKINLSYSVLIYEQYILSALARKNQVEMEYLIPNISKDWREVLNYTELNKSPFIHILGSKKKVPEYFSWLENQLLLRFPTSYYRIHEFEKHHHR